MESLQGERSIFYTCLCKKADKWPTRHWPGLFYRQLQQLPCTVSQSSLCTVGIWPETWRWCHWVACRKTQRTRMTPVESHGDGRRQSCWGKSGGSIVTIVLLIGQWINAVCQHFSQKRKVVDVNRTRIQATRRHEEIEPFLFYGANRSVPLLWNPPFFFFFA